MPSTRLLVLALDWIPNALHAGFYYAMVRNLYRAGGIDLHPVSPEEDNYDQLPIEHVLAGHADLGIGPPEHMVRAAAEGQDIIPLGSLLRHNTSAIATLASSGIDRPSLLMGKRVGLYGLPYEEQVYERLIRADLTESQTYVPPQFVHPQRLDAWTSLQAGLIDATWIYRPWEGMEARWRNIELNTFTLEAAGIPYPACPILFARRSAVQADPALYQRFLRITAEAYHMVAQQPETAAFLMQQLVQHPQFQNRLFIQAAMREVAHHLPDSALAWGQSLRSQMPGYMNWLRTIDPSLPADLKLEMALVQNEELVVK